MSSLIRASRSDQSARVGSVPWHGDTASVLSPASGTPESCLCTAPHKKNLCWEGGPPASGAAASLFWMDPWLMGSGGGTLVPHLGTAVHCPYSPAQSALQCPLPCPAAPPQPAARAGPSRSRWLCLAARCRSRWASRPGCAGPNQMIRLGAPRLLPAPRRREQIQSDGSHLWPTHCRRQPWWGAHGEGGVSWARALGCLWWRDQHCGAPTGS